MDENSVPENETPYTHGHGDAVLRSHRWRTASNSAAYLLAELRPGMSLLDVGCGPGAITVDLAAVAGLGDVVGIDPEPAVLDEARAAAAGRGVAATFEAVDVSTMAARAARRFDVVHAHQVLQHVADPVATLRSMAALAAPGGIVAARDADYSAMTWWPVAPALDRWLEVYRAVTRRNGAECDAGRRLLHWAQLAGIGAVTYTTSTWTYWQPDDLAWWCGLWADRIAGSRLAEQAVAYGIAAQSELDDIAVGWRAFATEPGATFMVPHGEVLVRVR